MPIESKMKKYPICDTDIWIKSCKSNNDSKIFEIYNKIFFADAVIKELGDKKKDDSKEFGMGYDYLEKYSNEYFELKLNENKFFNSKERKLAKRLFIQNKINYDAINHKFLRQKNLGEKVSLIYASIHKLDLMLSDDSESKVFKDIIKNRFKTVKVINFLDFLISTGMQREEAEKLRDKVSASVKDKEAEKQLNDTGSVSELGLLKAALRKRGKM